MLQHQTLHRASRWPLRALVVAALAGLSLAVPQAAHAAVLSEVDTGVLTVASDAGDAIAVTCVAGNVKVNGADPGTGAALCSSITQIIVTGGPQANTIDLSGVDLTAFTALTNVNVDAGAGDDTITGTPRADFLFGAAGNDRIVGGRGNDAMVGDFAAAGDDVLVWNNGDGSDVMEGAGGNDTVEVNGSTTDGDQFTTVPNGARVRFDRVNLVPFTLDIGTSENLRVNGLGGNDVITGAVGLRPLIDLAFNGGDGDDTITGGDGDDTLTGGIGQDRLTGARGSDQKSGDDGDDTLVWNNGDGSDLMEGATGADTVEVNGSTTDGDQFTTVPNGARVRFDRVNLVPFTLDIGTSENLRVNGLGGNDVISGADGLRPLIDLAFAGGDGDDTLAGGDGDDTLVGGIGQDRLTGAKGSDQKSGDDGDDVLVWNNGDGSDVMEGAIGTDTVEVNGSTTDGDQFLTIPNGARVRFDRVNLIPFTLDIGTTENLEVNGLGGNDVIAAAGGLQNLIGLAFDGGTGGDRLVGSTGDDNLAGGSGGDVIKGSGGRDRLDGEGGRDTLKGGGGQDWLAGAGGRDAFAAGSGNDRIDSSGQALERVNCGAGVDKVKGGVLDRTRANCEVVRP